MKPPVQGSQIAGVRLELEPPLRTAPDTMCMQRSPWAGALATRQPWSIPRGVNQWVRPVKELCFWVLECDGSSEEVELILEWTDVGLKGADRERETGGVERSLEGNVRLLGAPSPLPLTAGDTDGV